MIVRRMHRVLDRGDYYLANLYLAMAFIPVKLTPMEAKVLAKFMEAKELFGCEFCKESREYVKKELELSRGGLSNYERYMKGKGYIRKREDGQWEIMPSLYPERVEQKYEFILINRDNKK